MTYHLTGSYSIISLYSEMDMKRIFGLAGLALLAVAANASINFNITNQDQTIVKPTSGFVLATFSGTVTTSGGWAPSTITVEWPGNGSNFLTFDSFDAAFVAYLGAGVPNSNYSGDLFSIQVASTDADGLYDLNGSSSGSSPFAEAIFYAMKNGVVAGDNEYYSITVESVPEPVSMGILGLGALALIRRRRSK